MIELVAELNISDDLNADLNINRDLNADLDDVILAGVSSWNGQTGDVIFDGYTKTETDTLLSAKADDDDVVHIAGAETITGAKSFTNGMEVSRSTSGAILKLSSGASDTNFILERTGGSQCVLESGYSLGLFGTKTNHPLQVRTNYVNRMTFGTDGSVVLATDVASGSNDNQVATTKWVRNTMLTPLIGDTTDITPTQTLTAMLAGRPICLSHTNALFGLLKFNYFANNTGLGVIFSNATVMYSGMCLSVSLIGDTSTDTWTVSAEQIALTSDIPTYTLNKQTDTVIGTDATFTVTQPTISVSVTPSTTSVPNVTDAGSADTWAFTYNAATEEIKISGANGTAPTLGTAISVVNGISSATGSASGGNVAWNNKDSVTVLTNATDLGVS